MVSMVGVNELAFRFERAFYRPSGMRGSCTTFKFEWVVESASRVKGERTLRASLPFWGGRTLRAAVPQVVRILRT